MIEKVIHPRNLNRAYQQVVSNKGAAGVDGMKVSGLVPYLEANKARLLEAIRSGSYLPQAILGGEIPKADGRKRLLGVPTVTERLLQQAVHQVMAPLFEADFKEGSYGFRPGRNAQQAVLKAQGFINEGYSSVVDIDLENFFDEVDHCLLLQLVYRKMKCPLTLRLIRKWLRAPILIHGKLTKRRKGVPQGSPLSPLLSNILLHELDQYLEKQRLRYVRFADDFSLYAKTPYLAQKAVKSVTEFVEGKLRLKINRQKSGIRKPEHFQLLGYSLTKVAKPTKTQKQEKFRRPQKRKSYQLTVSPKSWDKLKERLKEITRKTAPKSFDERIQELKEVQRGWLQYFRLGNIYSRLREVDSWLRNRLRYCIWHDWKKPDRKRKNLIRLGVPAGKAYAWSRTRMGGWAVAQSPILVTTITLNRLRKRGYESLLDYYLKVAPQLNEPLYTGPVRTVV
jgi:group II intron reverse transcriptase/maturase